MVVEEVSGQIIVEDNTRWLSEKLQTKVKGNPKLKLTNIIKKLLRSNPISTIKVEVEKYQGDEQNVEQPERSLLLTIDELISVVNERFY
ncbi:hypothetical protein CR513_24802, partial [Mucuna pruriens]